MRVLAVLVALCCYGFSSKTPVLLVTGDNYPPFSDKSYPDGGFATEVVSAVMKEMKVPFNISWEPWKRGYDDVKQMTQVATFPYVKSAEREQEMLYSDPIVSTNVVFFGHKDGPDLEKVESLSNLLFCTGQGYDTEDLKPFIASANNRLEVAPDIDNCFKMLAIKRVQAILLNNLSGAATVKKLKQTEIKVFKRVIKVTNHYLIVSKANKEGIAFLKAFNQALSTVKANKIYDQILAKYEL